jgi:hypothetical protein
MRLALSFKSKSTPICGALAVEVKIARSIGFNAKFYGWTRWTNLLTNSGLRVREGKVEA